MANIVLNEISHNYTYNIGSSSYATVALPITACWGPGYADYESAGFSSEDEMLDITTWEKFPATQAGLEAFVSTYRGPATNYRMAKDYSYQMAMTLLTAGYDVLVCRVCPGTYAQASLEGASGRTLVVKAKYPGTFGNNLEVELKPLTRYMSINQTTKPYWNMIVRVVDASGVKTAVENVVFAFDLQNCDDTILYVDEIESNFVTLLTSGSVGDVNTFEAAVLSLAGGSDRADTSSDTASAMLEDAISLATSRFAAVKETGTTYISALTALKSSDDLDAGTASNVRYNEWLYNAAFSVYDLLTDKLTYNPQRIISPGWDDQNITAIAPDATVTSLTELSPLHIKLMDIAYLNRCGTSYLDIPKCLPRSAVYDESTTNPGYAQRLARYVTNVELQNSLYSTHSALFAPWGQYTYVGTSKQQAASPSFLALMIQRAQILNQTLQYEWALPTNRKHKLKIGKLDYICRKKELDTWQTLEGVGVNIITNIPELGVGIWGNSTLYEVPPATYQALANLSTRFLMNAVRNTVYKCGVAITFQYNNEQAYNKFYAGVTPLLDTMKNVGAIRDYYVRMAADVNGLDQVNANTVIGKIYLVVDGVINDIIVDLVALPPGVDLDQYKA